MKSKLLLASLMVSGAILVGTNQNSIVKAADLSSTTEVNSGVSFTGIFRYTNGLPIESGSYVQLKNQANNETISKTVNASGAVTFNATDGLKTGTSYEVIVNNQKLNYTLQLSSGNSNTSKTFTVNLPGAELPLTYTVNARYTNGLPLSEGTEVKLRNLTDGSTEVLIKKVNSQGSVTFTEADGLKKGVNYSVEVPGLATGYSIRYDLGGNKSKDFILETTELKPSEQNSASSSSSNLLSSSTNSTSLSNSNKANSTSSEDLKKQSLNVAATASHKATSATNLPTKKQVKNLPQTGTKSALLLTALGLLSLLASKLLFKRRIN